MRPSPGSGPDIAGVRKSLEWALPGDLLVLAVHQDRRAVLELLNDLTAERWKAGEPLPGGRWSGRDLSTRASSRAKRGIGPAYVTTGISNRRHLGDSPLRSE